MRWDLGSCSEEIVLASGRDQLGRFHLQSQEKDSEDRGIREGALERGERAFPAVFDFHSENKKENNQ